jgi:NifU-like protein involved in Fe-S cluster formation
MMTRRRPAAREQAVNAARLYTPEVLALAVRLADYPLDPSLPLMGEARSRSCGSELGMALSLDSAGRIAAIGLKVRACAIGQAAAALFVQGAEGQKPADIDAALMRVEQWLVSGGSEAPWPGLGVLEAARAYPARRGAILLPWKAAQAALGKAALPG